MTELSPVQIDALLASLEKIGQELENVVDRLDTLAGGLENIDYDLEHPTRSTRE